jgi:8-oxo-dGTP pyrophosphatase MutT (NUDIX family)
VDCAIREIQEEINIDVRSKIKEDRYIRIETRERKFVKLFIIFGIDDTKPINLVNKKEV